MEIAFVKDQSFELMFVEAKGLRSRISKYLASHEAAENQTKVTLAEARKMNGRMMTQIKKNTRAAEAWEQLCSLPSRGFAKNAKKRLFLFSWAEGLQSDGVSWGPSFWEEATTLLGQELLGNHAHVPHPKAQKQPYFGLLSWLHSSCQKPNFVPMCSVNPSCSKTLKIQGSIILQTKGGAWPWGLLGLQGPFDPIDWAWRSNRDDWCPRDAYQAEP